MNLFLSDTENTKMLLAADQTLSDRSYKGFPAFAEWQETVVNVERWENAMANLLQLGEIVFDTLRRVCEVMKEAAAIYTDEPKRKDQGIRDGQLTEIARSAMRQAAVEEKYLELQLSVYDILIDSAIECTPITEAWICELHSRSCHGQNTYMVSAADSIKECSLLQGNYKHLPNHVLRENKDISFYAPVEQTPTEMSKLCQELNSAAFLFAHPLLQASYAHYALVAIHPFSDGNGRVARALSFMFIYRANLIPTLELVKDRRAYLLSLKSADAGDFQPFINLVQERAVDAMNLTEMKIRAAV